VGSSLQYRQSLSSLALPYLGAYVTGESNDYSGQAIVEKSKGAAIAVVASYRWAGMLKNVSKSPQELQPVAAVTMPPGGNRLLHQCPRARSGPSGCYIRSSCFWFCCSCRKWQLQAGKRTSL
jgi:hypothetical protein